MLNYLRSAHFAVVSTQSKNMSTKPSYDQFVNWAASDENKSDMQISLRDHPDLANVKDSVSFRNIFSVLCL